MAWRLFIVVFLFVIGTKALGENENQWMGIGLYVVVKDMHTSRDFYQQVLRTEPFISTEYFVGYRVGGALFALYSDKA